LVASIAQTLVKSQLAAVNVVCVFISAVILPRALTALVACKDVCVSQKLLFETDSDEKPLFVGFVVPAYMTLPVE